MAKPTKDNRKSVVDFGVGWVVIIYCLLDWSRATS